MAVISRIMWTGDDEGRTSEELLDSAMRAIAPWAMEAEGIELPTSGAETFERTGATNSGLRTVYAQRIAEPCGLLVDVEDDDGKGAVWGVHVRLALGEGQILAWIDNTLESDTVTAPISVGRPRVVDALLGVGAKPRLGKSAIISDPQDISAAEVGVLRELLVDPERGLPVVVVTCGWNGFDEHGRARAESLAKRLTGLATVVMVDPAGQDALRAALPNRLGVWGGAIRVFAPGDLNSPAAHRLYSGDLLHRYGLDPVVNWVTALSSRRRPDHRLRLVNQAGIQGERRNSDAEIEALHIERERVQAELDNEILERADAEAELTKAMLLVRRLRQLGFESGRGDEVYQAEQDAEQADQSMTVSEAVGRARAELAGFLAIPEGADQELDRVDSAINSLAWGNTTWRGLRALADYARDVQAGDFPGGFWNWCANGGGSWPASKKKLSMSESDSVGNRPKFCRRRGGGVHPANLVIGNHRQSYERARL